VRSCAGITKGNWRADSGVALSIRAVSGVGWPPPGWRRKASVVASIATRAHARPRTRTRGYAARSPRRWPTMILLRGLLALGLTLGHTLGAATAALTDREDNVLHIGGIFPIAGEGGWQGGQVTTLDYYLARGGTGGSMGACRR
jgi:hypothetical protein